MSCEPTYSYRPSFTASDSTCTAPGYPETRARVIVAGLFFRSKGFGPERNEISVEIPNAGPNAGKCLVRMGDDIVETYAPTLGVGGIGRLRSLITSNASSIIDMNVLRINGDSYDIYDTRTEENDAAGDPLAIPPTTDGGLIAFPQTYLIGGQGGPTSDSGLASIRTGPERTLVIIVTTEDIHGKTVDVPLSRKTRQWDGVEWINYSNTVPGACPKEGT